MVFAALLGWALQQFAGLDGALLAALLIGLLIAPFVPAKGACPVRSGPPNGR